MSAPPPPGWLDRTGLRGAKLPTLSAERLVLRALEDRDVPALFAVFGDAEAMRYWSAPPLADLDAARAWLEEIRELFRSRQLFQWGVALRETDEVVGTCTLFRIELKHRRAEIGYAVARSRWGQGLGTEAVGTLLSFAFDRVGLNRIEADVDPRNAGSLRLLSRLGFRREGLLRERYHVGQEVQDSVMLGLLAGEWKRRGAPRRRPSGS